MDNEGRMSHWPRIRREQPFFPGQVCSVMRFLWGDGWVGSFWWILAAGPSALYGMGVRLRNAFYESGQWETVRLPVPVFCLGNLTVGGSGKTPGVLWLAGRLKAAGRRPVVVSRGYGRQSTEAVILAPNAGEPLPPATRIGDEPRLIASRLPGVPVAVGADRARAAERAWERFSPDCVVLDDGFQHRRLWRTRDFLCLDAATAHRVFVAGRPTPLLPAGPWRERPSAAARAQAWFFTRAERLGPEQKSALRAALSSAGRPLYFADYALSFRDGPSGANVPAESLSGAPVLALSGLGDPGGFEASLERVGARVAGLRFPDHHAFSDEDQDRAMALARAEGRRLIVTEKDAQRLPSNFPALVAEVNWRWEGEDPWDAWIESAFS